jgi:hypothetical protein
MTVKTVRMICGQLLAQAVPKIKQDMFDRMYTTDRISIYTIFGINVSMKVADCGKGKGEMAHTRACCEKQVPQCKTIFGALHQ